MANESDQQAPEQWYVRRGGRAAGPVSATRIRRHVLDGRLQLNDEVSRDRKTWQAIGSVPDVTPAQLRRDAAADAQVVEASARGDRRRAFAAISVSLGLLGLGAGIVLWLGSERSAVPAATCDAPPAAAVNWSHCRLDGGAWPSAVLTGADLSNASLINARLADADLSGADLAYANLAGADLSYARLAGARLLGANLRGADLAYAEFADADLSHADLGGARIGAATWQGVRLDGAIWVDGRRCASGSVGGCR